MSRIAYVNGRYLPLRHAAVNVEDRGYQFGDGIYEVIYVCRGRPVDAELHMARLKRSMKAIGLPAPMSAAALQVVINEVTRRNRVTTGLVYVQVTRGVARRDHPFPSPAVPPGLVVIAKPRPAPPRDPVAWAGAAITRPDERWARCDIKSTNLLPNVLARQAAREAGAYEAILYDAQGNVTEGAASTVWIVGQDGRLRTPALGPHILPGCTRAALIEELETRQIAFAEGDVSLPELRAAREIFLTGATSFVKPIAALDGVPVGDGRPGPVTTALFGYYLNRMG